MVVGVSGHGRRRPDRRRSRSCSATCRPTAAASPRRRELDGAAGPARRASTTRTSDQAHICLGVPSYPLEHPDRYALQLLATVLGTGMSSRLFLEVRERRGLAYYVYGLEPLLHRRRLALRAGGRRPQADRRGGHGDRRAVPAHGRRDGAGRRAREGALARQGPLRAPHREPAGADHVRPAPRGARGRGARAGGAPRRARRGHRRGRPARRAGPDRRTRSCTSP